MHQQAGNVSGKLHSHKLAVNFYPLMRTCSCSSHIEIHEHEHRLLKKRVQIFGPIVKHYTRERELAQMYHPSRLIEIFQFTTR
jgi:hypothetical protein